MEGTNSKDCEVEQLLGKGMDVRRATQPVGGTGAEGLVQKRCRSCGCRIKVEVASQGVASSIGISARP